MEKTLKILGIVIVLAVLLALYFTMPYEQAPSVSKETQQQENQTQEEDIIDKYVVKCTTKSGKTMTMDRAKEIALASDCGDRIVGEAFCNADAGTWSIDMIVQRPGCDPSCIVDIETEQAVIDWKCTGIVI